MSQPTEQTQIENAEAEFEPLKGFESDYEIQTTFPYNIKNKKTGKIIAEGEYRQNVYPCVSLNNKIYYKHILVAKQFIENPDNLPQVDHKNRIKTDYHLDNLRFVSSSENNKNKSNYKGIQYEFIDDIPDDAIVIDFYETKTERKEFEENTYYYYHDDTNNEDIFYAKITDNIYKILHINTNKSGNEFISMNDINNQKVSVYINRFKHQHDLI